MIAKILKVFKGFLKPKIVLPIHEVVTSSTALPPEENMHSKPKKLKHKRLKKLSDKSGKKAPKNVHPSSKPIPLPSGSKGTSNPQDTLAKINKVDQLRQQKRMTIEDACKQVGISPGYYYKLRSK